MYDNIYRKLGGLYMAKVIRLSLFLITISLFLTGCSNSKEDITLDIIVNELNNKGMKIIK